MKFYKNIRHNSLMTSSNDLMGDRDLNFGERAKMRCKSTSHPLYTSITIT